MRTAVRPLLTTLCLTTAPTLSRGFPLRPFTKHPFRVMSTSEGLTDASGGSRDACSDAILSWKSRLDISIAKSRKVRGGNYVQIATTSSTGQPRCRTVVFRGFQNLPSDHDVSVKSSSGDSCVMKMITDKRSNKVSEISEGNGLAEMVWWFGKSSEQYRIRGKLMFVGGGDFSGDDDASLRAARKEQWGNLSDMAREQFFWKDPGFDYASGDASTVPSGGRDEDGTLLAPPDSFLLMLLLPQHIDYLRLGDNYRQIDELEEDGTKWSMQRVNP